MRRLVPIVILVLIAILRKVRGFSLLNDPSLDSLLDSDESSMTVGCESYDSPYWDQLERAARQKLTQLRSLQEREGGRERRDSYGHEDTQVREEHCSGHDVIGGGRHRENLLCVGS